MTPDRDKYGFLSPDERVRLEKVQRLEELRLDVLTPKDRISIACRHYKHGPGQSGFVLEVASSDTETGVLFNYYPSGFGHTFYTGDGEVIYDLPAQQIRSGHSTILTLERQNKEDPDADPTCFRRGQSYWFPNPNQPGKYLIARNITQITILKASDI